MKVELTSDVDTLSKSEVVQQLVDCGAIELDEGEWIGESRIECGCDLEIEIRDGETDGCTETFTLADINVYLTEADAYAWAKDEDGNDILLCFCN